MELRTVVNSDYNALLRLLTDKEVRKFLGGAVSEEIARKRVDICLSEKPDSLKAIEVENEFAGVISFSKHCEEDGIEVSYELLPEFVGKGVAFRAMNLALQSVGRPVIAETQTANVRSRNLLKRLGFTEKRFCQRHNENQVIAVL